MNISAPESHRPQACPRCDYSLAGAPAEGTCPECGRPYDSTTFILHGQSAGKLANAWSTVPTRKQLLAYALYFIFFWWLFGRMRCAAPASSITSIALSGR